MLEKIAKAFGSPKKKKKRSDGCEVHKVLWKPLMAECSPCTGRTKRINTLLRLPPGSPVDSQMGPHYHWLYSQRSIYIWSFTGMFLTVVLIYGLRATFLNSFK